MPSKKRWVLPPGDGAALAAYDTLIPWVQNSLARAGLLLPPDPLPLARLLGKVLVNRGVAPPDALDYFEDTANEHSPLLLKGMEAVVARLRDAVRMRRRIAVYGDYDVDGVTATALVVSALKELGADVIPYIPHRVEEGYGLLPEALGRLREEGIDVVLSVDCGVRAVAEAQYARQIGLELLITDHHAVPSELPSALVINPRQPGCTYPCKDLSGVGIAYKLISALCAVERESPSAGIRSVPVPETYLDLVALGTVADVVPLRGENRALVRRGLRLLNNTPRVGIRELIIKTGLRFGSVGASAVGFALGPRLNAAGRMEHARSAYELLTTEDPRRALALAETLDSANRDRQAQTRKCYEDASRQIDALVPPSPVIVAASPDYPQGIVGLIASRLAETYYRPALAIEERPDTSKGSARSIPEFNIIEALDQCADLFVKHGGHKAAAGFTLQTANIPVLRERLSDIARRQLAGHELTPELRVDAEVTFRELDRPLLHLIDLLEPCGAENPSPLFVAREVAVRGHRSMGKSGEHLRLTLMQQNVIREAVAFREAARWAGKFPERVDLVFAFEWNEYNGMRSLQLNVKDMRAIAG